MNTSLAIKVILILGIIALAMWLWYKFWSHFKVPKTGCLCLVSGGIKAGKSTLAVYQAYVEYKRYVRVKQRFFREIFTQKFTNEHSKTPCSDRPLVFNVCLVNR